MLKEIEYNDGRHEDYAYEWRPHNKVYDCWSARCGLHDAADPEQHYSFYFSFRKMPRPLAEFVLNVMICDYKGHRLWQIDKTVPFGRADALGIEVDEQYLFCGNGVQLLNDEYAIAMNIIGADFTFDLCLAKKHPGFWMAEGKPVEDASGRYFNHVYPYMQCVGKLTIGGKTLRLEGEGCFERIYGEVMLQTELAHSERILLSLDDGPQLYVTYLPQKGDYQAYYLPKTGPARLARGLVLEVKERAAVEAWRFGSEYRLALPGLTQDSYILRSLDTISYDYPFSMMFAGVYDAEDKLVGHAYGELMPAARTTMEALTRKQRRVLEKYPL